MGTEGPAGGTRNLRIAEIAERIRQLQSRRALLSTAMELPASTAATVQGAAEASIHSQRLADEAYRRARQALLHSIAAHERTADRLDQTADLGIGDVPARRQRAAKHRDFAIADRAVLATQFSEGGRS